MFVLFAHQQKVREQEAVDVHLGRGENKRKNKQIALVGKVENFCVIAHVVVVAVSTCGGEKWCEIRESQQLFAQKLARPDSRLGQRPF